MQRGFTLIELLVVVLIIGILSAIALPQYQKAVTKTRFATCQLLVESMLQAATVFYSNHMEYAEDPDVLDIDFPTPDRKTYNQILKRTTFYYPWGYCEYHAGEGVGCYNEISGIGYQRSINGRKECKPAANNLVSQKVCQTETHKTTADYTGSDWLSYYYN